MTRMILSLMRHLRPDVEVRIFVPTRDRAGRSLSTPGLASAVAERLSSIVGGATTIAGKGTWNGRSKVVRERVQVVFTFFGSKVTPSQRLRFRRLIEELVIEANQAVLAVSIAGRLFLIPGQQPTCRASTVKPAARRSKR